MSMKLYENHTEAEKLAIVAAAAASWGVAAGKDRSGLREAFSIINPGIDNTNGEKSLISKQQAIAIRQLCQQEQACIDSGMEEISSITALKLQPHQLVTTDEDYHTPLPLTLNRAEVKILCALLQRRLFDDLVEGNQAKQMHEALLAKLVYHITDTPLP